MFSLIITIFSIALVAGLAVSGIYFLGDSFNTGTSQASVSTILNQSQQIAAAADIYRSQNLGTYPDELDDLTTAFLQSIPTLPNTYFTDEEAGGGWAVDDTNLQLTGLKTGLCEEIGGALSDLYNCAAGVFTLNRTLFSASGG